MVPPAHEDDIVLARGYGVAATRVVWDHDSEVRFLLPAPRPGIRVVQEGACKALHVGSNPTRASDRINTMTAEHTTDIELHGWLPLKTLMDQRFSDHKLFHDLLAENVRTDLAAMDKRLDGMNEFRQSLDDVISESVRRDVFDVVANRLTIVENTYVQRDSYTQDMTQKETRLIADFTSRDGRLQELEKNAIPREQYLSDLKTRDERIIKLETESVRGDALEQRDKELARTRKALVYTIVGGIVLTLFNFIVNAYQVAQQVNH